MTTAKKLLTLLKECRGLPAESTAEYLLAHGARIAEEPADYDYSKCPHMAQDGASCQLLTCMLCKNGKGLPCGFFPAEEKRRALIMDVSGNNKFHL